MAKENESPKMKQFYEMKEKHPNAILLFRCGDFYETYEQDANLCANVLGITLTKHKDGYHIATFPYQALDEYLPRLVRHCNSPEAVMKRVAICDQLDPPTPPKKRITETWSELSNDIKINPKNENNMKKTSNNNESANVQNAQVTNQYNVVTYQTKKGGTACYIMGFKTEAEAKAIADNACKTVGNTWRYNDKGEKVYALSFGSRYCDIATRLCEALNKGDKDAANKAIDETHDVYNAVVSAGRAEREEKRKAKGKGEKKSDVRGQKEDVSQPSGEPLYSMAEIAEMMKRAMAGEKVPELEPVKKAMGLAA